ncbi:uncharacterized protein B0I36DRAFT_245051 [Microdochium trichocladiopsis]|uniref:Zn(2)-C6 fungal-type domain-containing protein n=1 Tax=Microdochium trichocladiopsis TaxID=1682393 RepID=A0A9P8Y4V5_9PEZI|nr:uncharacterized protein B0I36DRAFT_245051 [Microdochium trichocladiopsis]KAH7029404.1 hypothetical protein B0I36DRAFT_245051 [Microdochium trichocladiopsis]
MVYCGKPSRGCQMCRSRRIKCDETKPTCNQCAKSRRQCPGYKDEFDLVFRNETQATERRARKASKKANNKDAQQQGSAHDTADSGMNVFSTTGQTMSLMPRPPVKQEADCYFLANFVMTPSETRGTRGFSDWIVPMMQHSGGQVDNHLQYAFNACSIALLNNKSGSLNRLNEKALFEYTRALSATNAALRDPKTQMSDSTLAAVLLLGQYENITARKIGTLSWGSHIEGAMQIVKARGKKQLQSEVGRLLFVSVRAMMIIHAITSGQPPPMGADWWIADAARDESSTLCQRFAIKAAEIRAEVARVMSTMQRTSTSTKIMMAIIRKCQQLDLDIQSWMQTRPENWQCKTVAWESSIPSNGDYSKLEVFPGRIDVFADLYVASTWSLARTTRMLMATTIMRCAAWVVAPVDYRTTSEYATSSRICIDMVTDIIASIPFHFGLRQRRPSLFDGSTDTSFACGDGMGTSALAGYLAVWPLGHIYHSDFSTDNQVAWVGGRLKYIGDVLGIKYALIVRSLRLKLPSGLIRRDGYSLVQNSHNILGILQGKVPAPAGTAPTTMTPNHALPSSTGGTHGKVE